jgi:hypothetical protein
MNVNPHAVLEVTEKLQQHTFRKFSLLRVRMKISYMAFKQEMTVQELMLKAILTTYYQLS